MHEFRTVSRLFSGAVVIALSAMLLCGCATSAHYPAQRLEEGEIALSASTHAGNPIHGLLSTFFPTLQGFYGVDGNRDVGVHFGFDRPVEVVAAGASYRHYFMDWFRIGLDATYHHAAPRLRTSSAPYFCEDYSFYIGPCALIDDRVMGRAVFQFVTPERKSGLGKFLRLHVSPYGRSGYWIADPGRRQLDPSAEVSNHDEAAGVGGGWTGLQAGAIGGISVQPVEQFSIQLDMQFQTPTYRLAGTDPLIGPGDEFGQRNRFRLTLSTFVRF